MTDKAIVNAIVPFLAENPDVHKAYIDNKNIPQSDKEHSMKELYDLNDKVDIIKEIPNMIKEL